MSDMAGMFAATSESGFAPSGEAAPASAFRARPFGDGARAMPGTAILALLDAAALAAGGQAPMAAAPDPIALARAEGYAAGRADAQAEIVAETSRETAAQERFRLGFERMDAALALQSAAWLGETVAALCEATLAPLALDREGLALRGARAIEALAEAEGTLTIRLNPADHAEVAPLLPTDWAFRPDPALARGVLAIAGPEGGVIDDPADWPRAIRAAIAASIPALAA